MNPPQSLSPWQMAMDFAQFQAKIWDEAVIHILEDGAYQADAEIPYLYHIRT